MRDSIRIPPEQWGRGAARAELPGAQSKISKGKRQPTPLQNSILNAYQTHQNINQASRRALQPAETTTRLQSGGSYQDIVHDLREMQNQPEHRRGVASDAKRRAAYLDNVLQTLDDEDAISPTVDHFINAVYGRPPAAASGATERVGAPTWSPTARNEILRTTHVELAGRVPWRAPKFFR